MAPFLSAGERLTTAARWPLGVALTSARYVWRTTPVHRWEMDGTPGDDAPPPLPAGTDRAELQSAEAGVGPLVHRLYRTRTRGTPLGPEGLMALVADDLDGVAPSGFAAFRKTRGDRVMAVGDEYVVRMPGPWDGPVRVVERTPTAFRLATLDGHLEAGQIAFRAHRVEDTVEVVIESWARSGDRLSDVLYSSVRMAKEIQLHLWISVLEGIVKRSGGTMDGGVVVTTRRVAERGDEGIAQDRAPDDGDVRRRLAALADRPLNFDLDARDQHTREHGWHVDEVVDVLPPEPPGPPQEDGSFAIARQVLTDYAMADPATVEATWDTSLPLPGRDMLLAIHYGPLRFYTGVRVGDVYDDVRDVDGEPVHVFGWDYRTLEGHFEQGQQHYEVWKWERSGRVEFHLRAYSKVADDGPWILRTGFRLVGRTQQLRFYRDEARRVRRITESVLETRRISSTAAGAEPAA